MWPDNGLRRLPQSLSNSPPSSELFPLPLINGLEQRLHSGTSRVARRRRLFRRHALDDANEAILAQMLCTVRVSVLTAW